MKATIRHISKARRAKVSSFNLKKGAVKKDPVKDLYKDLENG